MNRCGASDRRSGLTLLELLVVIVLLALVTATVAARVGGRLPQAQLAEATAQWEFTDQQLRTRARRTGQVVSLHLDVGGTHVECALDPEDRESRTIRPLPRGVSIGRYLSSVEDVTHGPAVVRYSAHGTTESYAVELASGRRLRRWIFVAGRTGQWTEVAGENEARELLEVAALPGTDAR